MLAIVLEILARVLIGDFLSSESSRSMGSLLGDPSLYPFPADIERLPIIIVLDSE
jgi:hypothetical protein